MVCQYLQLHSFMESDVCTFTNANKPMQADIHEEKNPDSGTVEVQSANAANVPAEEKMDIEPEPKASVCHKLA